MYAQLVCGFANNYFIFSLSMYGGASRDIPGTSSVPHFNASTWSDASPSFGNGSKQLVCVHMHSNGQYDCLLYIH